VPEALVQDDRIFLSTLPPARGQRRLALAAIVVSAAIFIAVAPFAKVLLSPVAAFIPIYQSALVINDVITAVLLFGQFSFLKSRGLLVLASGYLFSAFMAVSHALTFPGLFAPTGLLSAGPQSTAWLYFIWHAGFPLFIIGYAQLTREGRARSKSNAPARVSVLLTVVATLAAAAALTMVSTMGHEILPAIMQGNRDAPAKVIVATTTWMLSLVALAILLRRRPHSVLDLWLMVVLCAWLFDSALASVLNSGRYDVGWYAGRVYGLLASSFVLLVLLVENSFLYARLFKAHEAERHEREQAIQRTVELAEANSELDASRAELDQRGTELEEANLKLAESMAAKDRFLATMSHELRTPLNAIIGFCGTLLMRLPGPITADQERQLGIIQGSARHLLSLINDLLNLARIQSGKVTLIPEAVAADDVVGEVIEALRPMAEGKGLRLEGKTPAVVEAITTDRRSLLQILMNLANNAVKYTDVGSVTITMAQRRNDDRLLTEFAVKDTGIGIKEEDRARLFHAFERAGGHYESTGLGLYYSRVLAELLDGKIVFQSESGRGSTFTLFLSSDPPQPLVAA